MKQKLFQIRKNDTSGQMVITIPKDVNLEVGDYLSFTPHGKTVEIKRVIT